MSKITSRFPKRFNTPRGQRRLKCNVPTNYQCGGKCQPIKNKCNKEALGMAKDGLAYLKAVEERKARIAAVNAKRGGRTQYAVDDLGNVSRGTEGRAADPGKRFYKGGLTEGKDAAVRAQKTEGDRRTGIDSSGTSLGVEKKITDLTKLVPVGRKNVVDYSSEVRNAILSKTSKPGDPLLDWLDVVTGITYAQQTGRFNPSTEIELFKIKGNKAIKLIGDLMSSGKTTTDVIAKHLNESLGNVQRSKSVIKQENDQSNSTKEPAKPLPSTQPEDELAKRRQKKVAAFDEEVEQLKQQILKNPKAIAESLDGLVQGLKSAVSESAGDEMEQARMKKKGDRQDQIDALSEKIKEVAEQDPAAIKAELDDIGRMLKGAFYGALKDDPNIDVDALPGAKEARQEWLKQQNKGKATVTNINDAKASAQSGIDGNTKGVDKAQTGDRQPAKEKQWVTYLQNDGTKSRKKLTGEQIERIKTKWGKTDDDIAQGRITLRQIKSVTSASTMKPSTKATKPVAEKTSRPIDSIDTENPDLKAAVARATYGKAYGSPVSGDRFQRVLIDGQTYDVPESDFDVKQDAKAIAASQHLSRINAGEISVPSPAKPKAANPKPTRQTKAETGNDAAINVKPPMESDKSGYDFDALGNAHRHFITNTRHVGQSYKEGFESFMAELESKLKESTPADRQGEIPDVLNASKQKYFRLLDSIKSTAEGAYSVMMAGGSKFNSKQAARRGSSYDRSLSNFTSGLRSIESDALRKTGAQDVIDAKESAKIIKKQQSEKEAKQILKEIQAKFKKTPIVNDPTYKSPKPITKAQWAKIPSDYKSVMIDPETGVRYRADMTRPVYITDQKDTPLSKAEEAIAKLFAELEESGYRNPAKFIPTNFSEPRSPLTSSEKVKRARELRAKPQIRYTFVR